MKLKNLLFTISLSLTLAVGTMVSTFSNSIKEAKGFTSHFNDLEWHVYYYSGDGEEPISDELVSDGEKIILPTCTFDVPEHMHFVFWDINGDTYDPNEEYTVTADTTIRAIWAFDEFDIIYHSNGGTGEMANTSEEYGSVYILPTCGYGAPSGKTFDHWLIAGKSYDPGEEITITGITEIYAFWEDLPPQPVKYSLSAGAVVGIVLGGVIFTIGVAFVLTKFVINKKK